VVAAALIPAATRQEKAKVEENLTVNNKTILLVEDNLDDEILTLRALERNNIRNEVVVVRDGAEALDYLFARGTYAPRTDHTPPCALSVLDAQTFNIVPTWALLPGFTNVFTITLTVDNLGLGPNVSFIYTGVYDPLTSVPGNPSQLIPAITGTYFVTGDGSACSVATQSSPGTFVATLLPTISSGSASGSLDGFTAEDGSAFDSTVDATITFSAPPAPGQIAGTVSLTPNPTFGNKACFAAATNGVVDSLTINSDLSTQSGVAEYIYAEGFDPQGVPTKLFLNGFSVNLYSTLSNTDPHAIQITSDEWAVAAAIGEDNPSASPDGVSNDGTNNVMVFLYGVVGGACDGAGGIDLPFHYVSGTPIVHKHKKHVRSGGAIRGRGRIEPRENWRQSFRLPETRPQAKTN
jgi:hypothetical protein